MIPFLVHDSAGRILRFGTVPEEAAVQIQAHAGETARIAEAGPDDWWNGHSVVPRPLPPAPPALVAGVEAVWAGLPPGAGVTATDPATGIVAGASEADAHGNLPLTLPAGPWRIEVNPPFPTVAREWLIEVAPE